MLSLWHFTLVFSSVVVITAQYLSILRHISLMERTRHYVPSISRPVVAALYHEAKRRRIPMTKLVNLLLTESLNGSPGWVTASQDWPELAGQHRQDRSSD